MSEVQSPTPTGTSKPYRSLTEALRAHRIDPANHAFIDAIISACDVTSLIDRGRYIEALRRGDAASLHIGKTYTNGFTEGEEIRVGGATLRLQPSEGRPPYFYVDHPSIYGGASAVSGSSVGRRGARRPAPAPENKPVERDYGVCDVCFMTRTVTGACGCD